MVQTILIPFFDLLSFSIMAIMIAKKRKNKKRFLTPAKKSLLFTILLLPLVIYMAAANIRLNEERQKVLKDLAQVKETANTYSEKEKNLNSLLTQASTPAALEKVARESFNLQKPGEKILVVKKEDAAASTSGAIATKEAGFSLQTVTDWVKGKLGIVAK